MQQIPPAPPTTRTTTPTGATRGKHQSPEGTRTTLTYRTCSHSLSFLLRQRCPNHGTGDVVARTHSIRVALFLVVVVLVSSCAIVIMVTNPLTTSLILGTIYIDMSRIATFFISPPQRSILASFMTMTSTSPPTSTPRVPMCSMESPTECPSVPGKAICSKRVSR